MRILKNPDNIEYENAHDCPTGRNRDNSLYARYLCSRDALGLKAKRARDDRVSCIQDNSRMMINHSTLEYHVTNFNTFFRWALAEKIKTLTLFSDPNT